MMEMETERYSEGDDDSESDSEEENAEEDEERAENSLGDSEWRYEPLKKDYPDSWRMPRSTIGQNTGMHGDRTALRVEDWCRCGVCVEMMSSEEYICCTERKQTSPTNCECITDYEVFRDVCLNPDVLRTIRPFVAEVVSKEDVASWNNRTKRFVAYRAFVSFFFGTVGKGKRTVLPSCVVRRIREEFPSVEYVGFQQAGTQSSGKDTGQGHCGTGCFCPISIPSHAEIARPNSLHPIPSHPIPRGT